MAELRLFDAGASSAMPVPAAPDPNEILYRATRMIIDGRVAEGRALLEDLVARHPTIPDAWNNLASARRTLGDTEGGLAAAGRRPRAAHTETIRANPDRHARFRCQLV